ncbi:MAG: sulfotransferase [Bacteroidetes bacterium]|nr:sulfotransferase [Bacteroidota bacterium]
MLDKVVSYYPKSKFIILHRDPRDNVLVKLKRAKVKGRGRHYFILQNFGITPTKLLTKNSKISSDKFIHVKYEDLVSKPEQTLQVICKF